MKMIDMPSVESPQNINILLKGLVKLDRRKLIVVFFLFILFNFGSYAQTLSGVVTSSDGAPIPFASIYIKELTTGTTSNLMGEYSVELPSGISHVSFQALSFAKVQLEVNMEGHDIVKNIELKAQDYKIKEVRVFSGNEDPAYGIIRKSIGLAPYFLRQIKHYKANVYLKGGFDMNKVPRLFRKQLKEQGIEEGKSYLAESVNEITFNSPNRYVHKQISKRSTIPNDGEDEVLGFLNYSFYDSESDLAISPISRKALSFYKYRYEGFFQEGDYYVNKIKVIPKRKNQKLFAGYIYIVDKLWNLHSVDLLNEQFFGKIRIKQVQEQVKGKAWLPVSHHFDVDVKMMGFNVEANYGGSVKYDEVELNSGLPVPSSLKIAYAEVESEQAFLREMEAEKPLSKNQQKVEALLKKDDLSNREMMKLSRLMEKENKSVESLGKGLRLESQDSLYQIVRDTVSADAIDWNEIRPIPLTKSEIESFGIRDSLTLALAGMNADSVDYAKEPSAFSKGYGKILFGGKHYSSDSTFRIKYDGLLNPMSFGFNAVDGLTFHQKFKIKKLLDPKGRVDFFPELKYSFGRKNMMWKLRSVWGVDYITHTKFFMEGGQWSRDFNGTSGISPFVNMVSSLLLKDNYMKLYKDNYFLLGGRSYIANGLMFNLQLRYQNLHRMENSTQYSLAYPGRNYRDNNEVLYHMDPELFRGRRALDVEAQIDYTPKYYYRINGNYKRMVHSDYPTFMLRYKGGFSDLWSADSRYDLLVLGISQKLEWSFMYHLTYDMSAGYFFDHSSMHFSHFKHFNTSEIPVSFKSWERNFNLLNDYEYSTNEWYLEGHFSYSTPYLLIKNIPFLQDKLWNENIYLSHLTQADFRNYNEVGYGISQLFLVANIGVFAGFEEMQFERWGFRLSFNLGSLE
ncbi:DUF5686 family protein [Saccharicrinis fermentans]|uniref:DUF5686 family protein n=1 Tax=Saccharicrinis fermentans TaxID=982 RepID=UPI00048436D4|nr:DUF5686 family protein [Saccharicrinis fermentans]